MIILGIRSYLQNKAKQQTMTEIDTDDSEDGNADEYEDNEENEIQEEISRRREEAKSAEELLVEIIERAAAKKAAEKESLTTEVANSAMFEEGSSRKQHSTQYEASPHKSMANHNMHPDYNSNDMEQENSIEMTPEKMRQALIYQTIIERPEY